MGSDEFLIVVRFGCGYPPHVSAADQNAGSGHPDVALRNLHPDYEPVRLKRTRLAEPARGTAPFVVVTCNIGCMARRQSSSPTAIRVRAHRQRLREQGLRPIQIWVPDVRSPQFAEQAHQQSLAIASSRHDADDQAFIDALADDE